MRGILVVDDDHVVRRFVSVILELAGYPVFQAAGGLEALEILRHQAPGIGLVLTDICMPGLDGTELGRRTGNDYPDIEVIYMTGFSGARPEPDSIVLYKPFTAETVRNAVAEAMERR